MDKQFSLKINNDSFDDYIIYYSNEEELINAIIDSELSPEDFTICKILNPRDYDKYNKYLKNISDSIVQKIEKSKLRLKELELQKYNSATLLKNNVYIFDNEIKKETESINKNLKRLESCNETLPI